MEDNSNQEPKNLEFDSVVMEQVNLNVNEVDISKIDEIQNNQETKSFIQNQSSIEIIQEIEDPNSVKQEVFRALPQKQIDPIQPIKDQQNSNQMNSQLEIHEAIIKISKDSRIDKQSIKLIQTLINKCSNNSDIEIKVSSIKPEIQVEMSILLDDLKTLGVNAISETKKEYQQKHRMYYVQGQPENNISKQDKMVFLYLYHFNYFNKGNQNFPIVIDPDQCVFELRQNRVSGYSTGFELQNFKQQLDKTVVLSYMCKYESEAQYKSYFLNKYYMRCKLNNWLDMRQLNIFPSFTLLQEVLSPSLRQFAEQIATSKPQIIVIGICQENTNLKQLQEYLTQFIQNEQNISKIDEIYQLQLTSEPPKESETNQKLKELLTKDLTCEITATAPQFDLTSNKYVVSIQIQFWFDSSCEKSYINSQIHTLKNKIERIYTPTEEIRLNSYGQIRIWQNLLSSEFESTKNSKECQTKYKSQYQAKIELRGDAQMIIKKKQQILEVLNKYEYVTISYTCDQKLLKVLSEKQQFQQLFRESLDNIGKQFGNTLIRILDVEYKVKLVLEIFYLKEQKVKQITDILEQQFIKQLVSYLPDFEMQKILSFLKLRETKFQEQFEVYFCQDEKKPLLVGLKQKISEIEKIIKQINEYKATSTQSFSVDCQNKLILQKMLLFLKKNEQDYRQVFSQNSKLFFMLTKTSQQQSAQLAVDNARQQFKSIEAQLVRTQSGFSEREVKYIRKNLASQLQQYEKDHEMIFQFNQSEEAEQKAVNSTATILKYNDKTLKVAYADISKIQCDAIINSCNEKLTFGDPSTLSGVAQSIFDMAGSSYHSFCDDYIKKNSKLKVGDAITYNMPIGKHIKHIINVATPIYSSGNKTENDLLDIIKNLNAAFKAAENLQIQSIALPIFGGGACGYNFGQLAQMILREVINMLFVNNSSIKVVYITETMDTKISILQEKLQIVLKPPKQVREIQYQWQWKSDQGFINYDDEDINKQIDEAYEQYLVTKQEYKVNVHFSFTKQPGTHKVDLVNYKLTQIAISKDIPFCYKMINNSKKYFINNEPAPDQLTEYFILQEFNKQTVFTIFYSCYCVIFNDKEMYQMNQETKFKRLIQPTKTDKYKLDQQKQVQGTVLSDKAYSLENQQYEKQIIQQSLFQQMSIISFDLNLNQKIIENLNKIQQMQLLVKLLKFLFQKQMIYKLLIGNIAKDTKITLEIFKAKEQKIDKNIDLYKLKMKQYPPQWVKQNENLIKHTLSPNDEEYKMIVEHFKKSDTGSIHEIRRIQNKALWDNYITEKNKLINIYQQSGIQLTQIEQERYFWHGVRGQHPKVIYSGLKEAFDSSYSNPSGGWGGGIYFAEKAQYSRSYSYTLTQQDDPTHVGKKVFLYCLVTTGKAESRGGDTSIKRPSLGYDCVSSTCNTIFILYSMDIRRAYPAYEVIFT